MKPVQTQEQIDEMRRRLYDRGSAVEQSARHELTDTKVDVSRNWDGKNLSNTQTKTNTTDLRQSMTATGGAVEEVPVEKPKRHYRAFILSGSSLIFIFVAAVSSLFLYFGGNQISSDNIQITMDGPTSIGGGEVMSLQVAVGNQNSVPMESATLILKYPSGTRSIGDSPRNLFEERIPIEDIEPGEVQNVPVSVAIFGEENAEKTIEATIEYRVSGSNGMFYKDANPLAFRISSSPLVLRIDNITKVAAGQLVDITMTAVSNASAPLTDILVSASYPNGFIFEKSTPEPVSGQNVWRIDELLPDGKVTIKLQGIVTGLTNETLQINFVTGPSDTENKYSVGANLAEGKAEFVIERPFIDVQVTVDGESKRDVVIAEGESSSVGVIITNTLDETVYDMAVEVVPGGNALNEDSIRSRSGFYDSNRGTVRWEVSNNSDFDKIFPGSSRSLSFNIVPGPNKTTASYDLIVNVYARRVAETSAVETLIGTARTEAKYSSSIKLGNQLSYKSGPIPPKVGENTVYTLTLVAEAGANDMSNAVVETSLPLYVDWLDNYDAEGNIDYNPVSKAIKWTVGDISSGNKKSFIFDVGIVPSISQVKSTPVLIDSQTFRANDRFTGSLLQDSSEAVRTELSSEMGFDEDSGRVIR